MNSRATRVLSGLLLALIAAPHTTTGQLLNGDFSSGLSNWVIFKMPANEPVQGTLEPVDIDGSGPLGISDAFGARAGLEDQRRLQQNIFLVAGVVYRFALNAAMFCTSYNGDGGTVILSIGPTQLGSAAFGTTVMNVPEYATISGTYTPPSTGEQFLTIDISRSFYAYDVATPVDYIDNVQFEPVPEPLYIQGTADGIVLTWTNTAYVLVSAPSPSGTYTNIPHAISPYTNAVSASANYFRLVAN